MSEKGDKGITTGECCLSVSKDSPFVEAVGSIDELQARIGSARVLLKDEENDKFLHIETSLSEVMGVLYEGNEWEKGEDEVKKLEDWIGEYKKGRVSFGGFLIPGNNELESRVNLCRTGCRTAERSLVALKRDREAREGLDFDKNVLGYFNRLSTYFFWMWQSKK